MKVLVTGGTGLIGRYLKDIMPDATFVGSRDFDLCSAKETKTLLMQEEPDWIIHAAAKVGGIIDNIKNPCSYMEDNILMNTNIVREARRLGVKYLTGIISTCAYPDIVDSYPLKESQLHDGPPANSNFGYGIAKRLLASQIDLCNQQYETNYNYIIPCNLYGYYDKYDSRSHFVGALIKMIYNANKKNQDKIMLMGDGSPIRQFVYAGDVAAIIKMMIEKRITDSFNIATPEIKSISDIAVLAIYASFSSLDIGYIPNTPNGQYRKDADCKKLQALFPDFEFTSLFNGIQKTYNYYKNQKDGH